MIQLFNSWDRTMNQLDVTNQFGDQQLTFQSRPSELCITSADVTPTSSQSANVSELAALQVTEVDNFDLYRAKTSPRTPRFEKQQVNLVDQWIDSDVEVSRPMRFGAPSCTGPTGDDQDIPSICPPAKYFNVVFDPNTYLTCYTIRKAPKFEKRDVDINNVFGQQRITVKRPELLCVPTSKADTN